MMLEKISQFGFKKIVDLIRRGESGVVLCCTMNEIVMAEEEEDVKMAMNRADIITPDGMPLVWYLHWKYGKGERVYGPDLMRDFVKPNEGNNYKMLFIGDKTNQSFFEKHGRYLTLPFKNKFLESDYVRISKKISTMNVKIVWLGLGAKKQLLMADGLKRHGVKIPVVTVGAAFDFLSGNKKQAPKWIRVLGMEWLFRIMLEPKRLWGRYRSIIIFVFKRTARYLSR